MLVKILTETENSQIKQYKLLFAKDNVNLEFTDEAMKAIAELTMQRQTGARGLCSILVSKFFFIQRLLIVVVAMVY